MVSNSIPSGKTGLALGSGSARGWAHIGVIRALEEAGITIDCVAGTSIGALVGAVYASGKIREMKEAVLQLNRKQILMFSDIVLPKSGLIDGRKITNLVEQYVLNTSMESLPLPLHILATDLTTGREVVLKKGDIVEAVRASLSIPGVFTPVRKDGNFLVDGGLVNPVPVRTVKEMGASFVIAVDLTNEIQSKGAERVPAIEDKFRRKSTDSSALVSRTFSMLNEKLSFLDPSRILYGRDKVARGSSPGIPEILMNSIKIMKRRITVMNLEADPPDILIQPNLEHINFMGFYHAEEIIAEGYRAAKSQLANWNAANNC
ncbi:MAG: patatin-like phospholipase family protein [Candidatus Sabulitectum sp.]|nr:patatin-like phospholipase family protein [Candidatus Sabulitectum sp.]